MTNSSCTDRAQRHPTRKAVWECAEWLDSCVRAGWEKSALDRLQEIWWEYHDDEGNLVQ